MMYRDNLPSTTLAKNKQGQRDKSRSWSLTLSDVSMDFQLVDWPISREAGPTAKHFCEQLKHSGAHFLTLDAPLL